MANIIQRIFRGTLSVITTFVLMAAPIAAIVYFSEPATQSQKGLASANYMNSWQAVADKDEQVGVIKQTFVTEPIIALVRKLGD